MCKNRKIRTSREGGGFGNSDTPGQGDVLVIAEHLDILFFHYSKIVFEYASLAIFAGTLKNNNVLPFTVL